MTALTPGERRRAVRLAAWAGGLSVGVLAAAVGLTSALPPAAEGARAFAAWCGIG